MMLNKFHIIRHGKTDWNTLHLINGTTDIGLNQEGLDQARNASEKIFKNFHTLNFKTIFHSQLSRAKDTAFIINQKLNLQIFEIEEFGEINFGELEGKPYIRDEMWKKWQNGEFIGNGIEAFEDCKKRVKIGLEKVSKYQNPLIVAHGGIFVIMCLILKVYNFTDIHFTNSTLYCIENRGLGYTIFDVLTNE